MAERQFLTLNEIKSILDDPDFLESIDTDCDIDIVQLPPDNVDEVSDLEEINEDDLEDTAPRDVPGNIELHCNITETTSEDDNDVVDTAELVDKESKIVSEDNVDECNTAELVDKESKIIEHVSSETPALKKQKLSCFQSNITVSTFYNSGPSTSKQQIPQAKIDMKYKKQGSRKRQKFKRPIGFDSSTSLSPSTKNKPKPKKKRKKQLCPRKIKKKMKRKNFQTGRK